MLCAPQAGNGSKVFLVTRAPQGTSPNFPPALSVQNQGGLRDTEHFPLFWYQQNGDETGNTGQDLFPIQESVLKVQLLQEHTSHKEIIRSAWAGAVTGWGMTLWGQRRDGHRAGDTHSSWTDRALNTQNSGQTHRALETSRSCSHTELCTHTELFYTHRPITHQDPVWP